MDIRKRLFGYILRYKWSFINGAICGAGGAGVNASFGFLVERFFKALEKGQQNQQLLLMVCVGTIGLYLIKWVFTYGQTYFLSLASNRVAADLRTEIYAHIQSLPLSFFDRTRTGHIISRIANDVGAIQNGSGAVIPLVQAPLTIIGCLTMMFLTSWKLSLVSVVVAPFMAMTISKIGKRMRKLTSLLQISLADLMAALEDSMVGVRVIKSFGTEDYEINKFVEHNKRSLRAAMRGVKRSAAVAPTVEVLGAVIAVGVIWLGASQVQAGHLAPGQLIAYFVWANLVSASARQLGQVGVAYNQT
ncbi:MAG: ABC transporter transmembrane domain-containing protein, partial [Armatimonadota bacterium]|nr:ABC transporter transmembrane domain-containing protein [Armatimonadota bacterium]